MQFRTEINLPPSVHTLSLSDKLLLIGSCFAQNIGQLLQEHKFEAAVNPSGILYNPLSVAQTLQLLLNNTPFTKDNLFFFNEQWLSFAHHGSFSDANADRCLQKINNALAKGRMALQQARYLIITLGTTYVYHLKTTGQVVANCHKLPDAMFTRSRLALPDVLSALVPAFEHIWQVNPGVRIILTVSPVRHWKDGAVNNQLSKATLVLAAHELRQLFNEQVDYFPAYELMMDDLRDYRFYEPDMLHPAHTAIAYIWQKFSDVYFSAETRLLLRSIEKITTACKHTPFNPHSNASRQFVKQQLTAIAQLLQQHAYLNFTEELNFLQTTYQLPPLQ